MGDQSLSELLMKKKRLEVVNLLLENREKDFTISELSEKSGVGYKTVHGLVGELEKFGVIHVEEKGGSKMVSPNTDSPYVDTLEELGSIDSEPLVEVAKEFAEEIKREYSEIKTVVLFGSVLHGFPTQESDIDILVLVDPEVDEIERIEEGVWAIRDRYEREKDVSISPVVMDQRRFELNAKNKSPFESKVQETGKVLEGESLE